VATAAEPGFLATPEAEALSARGHTFTTSAEIGAATGIEFLGKGAALAAAEPVRRGGGSAMALPGGHDHGGRQHAWRGAARSRR
jgi:gamma-glutamyltranspeptidase / glutathione hydrolase